MGSFPTSSYYELIRVSLSPMTVFLKRSFGHTCKHTRGNPCANEGGNLRDVPISCGMPKDASDYQTQGERHRPDLLPALRRHWKHRQHLDLGSVARDPRDSKHLLSKLPSLWWTPENECRTRWQPELWNHQADGERMQDRGELCMYQPQEMASRKFWPVKDDCPNQGLSRSS